MNIDLPTTPNLWTASARSTALTSRLWNVVKARSALLTGLASAAVFLLAWQYGAKWIHINPLFISSPSAIFREEVHLFGSGYIFPQLATSGYELGIGYGLGIAVGIPFGVAMGRVRFIRNVCEPFLMALYATPDVALIPVLILWLGLGGAPKICLVFLASVFIIIVNTQVGISSADPKLSEAVRSFTGNGWQVLRRVELPWATPFIIAGLRLSFVRAMVMVIVAEMIMSTRGLGYMIMQFGSSFNTAGVFAGIAIVVFISTVFTQVLRRIEAALGTRLGGSQH